MTIPAPDRHGDVSLEELVVRVPMFSQLAGEDAEHRVAHNLLDHDALASV